MDHKGHNHDHHHDHQHDSQENADQVQNVQPLKGEILTTFKVSNMDCADEVKAINVALQIKGVRRIQSNLMASTIQIIHADELTVDVLKERIETTVVRVISKDSSDNKLINRNRIFIVGFSGFFLLFGLCLQWFYVESIFDKVFFFLSIVLGGRLVFPKAYGALIRKTLDMNVLMALAVIGAICIKEYAEASAVVFLFSLSELLESLSVQRARKAIQELLKIAPQTVTIVDSQNGISEIKVDSVLVGQIIRVKAGENIPLDGKVLVGESSVNQASLTGESMPVFKTVGDMVFAGTINQEGSLDVQVDKVFSDSKISQVIQLVEEAQSQRAASQKFVDRFAEIYTPVILVIAIFTFLIPPLFFGGIWSDWLYKSLILLVIACPCALVISTPVAIVSSLTALAKKGVLVKGGSVLEVLGKIKALAIDKTGTLTEGKPKVQEIVLMNSMSEDGLLEIAASLESHSTHPLAEAIINHAKSKDISLKTISNFKNLSGLGVEATLEGHHYFLGNHKFAHHVGVCTPELEKTLELFEEKNLSVIVVGHKPHEECAGEIIGVIALGDVIRLEAYKALQKIKKVGVEKVMMLSGDSQKIAVSIGNKVGVDESLGNLLPEGKAQIIEQLQEKYGVVAMVGDGVNDAPAMAKSSVGIAMGFAGSDTAIETADMTLMTDNLNQVALAIDAGRRTLKIIQFNVFFALVTKALFLILAFFGHTNLWIAVAADTGAALVVIMNSLRLLKVDPQI